MSWKCNIAGCIAERCEFSEIIVNAEDYRNLREREQRMYTDFSKSRDRIAQLEAALREITHHEFTATQR